MSIAFLHVLIADDHEVVRAGLTLICRRLNPDVQIVSAADLAESIRKASELIERGVTIDLAILDLRMPGMDGVKGVDEFAACAPGTPIVILSGQYERSDVIQCFRHGVAGFVSKSAGADEMANGIRLVLGGGKYIPADILADLETGGAADITRATEMDRGAFNDMTEREKEVLAELTKGISNKMIANNLGIQEITVKVHLLQVYRKLGVKNRVQAVKMALDQGWFS